VSPAAEAFVPLSDDAVRAVSGPHSRHAALIEDAFKVMMETPGGGVRLRGDNKSRETARRAVDLIARRVETGAAVDESDVRAAISAARSGDAPTQGSALPLGRRGVIAPKTAAQARYLEALGQCELVFGTGPAGTGKTFIAVAYGASLLMRGEVDRLVVTRPAVEAGERLGFLPGDMAQKVDPYLRPMYDALYEMMGFERVARFIERNAIEVAPLAFMRGRSLNESFIILDEAQNTTIEQMKMFLTRIGFGSRAVVTGDLTQTDLPSGRMSGLQHAQLILRGVAGVAFTFFDAGDVVRHALVQRIVQAYEAHERASPP